MARIGLISDTHGLLRPEAVAFLRGSDHIIHGGDIGGREIITQLSTLAPVTVVRGNNDKGPWADALPETEFLRVGEIVVYVIHDLARLDLEPRGAGVHVVVSGHSHKPSVQRRDGVLYLNPGSAGPRRFRLPISAAEVLIEGRSVSPHLVELVAEA